MTSKAEREAHYRAQTGSRTLTPRQQRRVTHKLNHQLRDGQAPRRAQRGAESRLAARDEAAGGSQGWTMRDLTAMFKRGEQLRLTEVPDQKAHRGQREKHGIRTIRQRMGKRNA